LDVSQNLSNLFYLNLEEKLRNDFDKFVT